MLWLHQSWSVTNKVIFIFLIYVNDLPQHIDTTYINVLADDSVLYTTGKLLSDAKTELQQSINDATILTKSLWLQMFTYPIRAA